MAVNFTGIVGDLTNLIPSSSDVLQQVAIGAGASVVLAGLKTNAGLDAIDPLHIIHRPATDTAPASTSAVAGKSISAAALAALPVATQQAILAAGYAVI